MKHPHTLSQAKTPPTPLVVLPPLVQLFFSQEGKILVGQIRDDADEAFAGQLALPASDFLDLDAQGPLASRPHGASFEAAALRKVQTDLCINLDEVLEGPFELQRDPFCAVRMVVIGDWEAEFVTPGRRSPFARLFWLSKDDFISAILHGALKVGALELPLLQAITLVYTSILPRLQQPENRLP